MREQDMFAFFYVMGTLSLLNYTILIPSHATIGLRKKKNYYLISTSLIALLVGFSTYFNS